MSKPSFMRCGAIACPVLVATSSVWPSAGAFAVASAAIVFDAPGLFSTTNGWPIEPWYLSASMRAMMSVPPPALAPTMIFTGRAGYVCAATVAAASISAPAARPCNFLIGFSSSGAAPLADHNA